MSVPESPLPRGEVDYAEPTALGPSRGRDELRPETVLWGGRGRRSLQQACVLLSLVLAGALAVALALERPGAASPEAAVEQLIGGIAALDGPAIVAVVAPAEVADVARTETTYRLLGERVLREGEVPPVEVDRVLAAAEEQLGGDSSSRSLAVLAAVDLDLDGLDLVVEELDESTARVYLVDGTLAITVDPARLPGETAIEAASSAPAGYDMDLAEGWQRDGEEIVAYLVAVEVDGRWFVSLEASADDLLGAR